MTFPRDHHIVVVCITCSYICRFIRLHFMTFHIHVNACEWDFSLFISPSAKPFGFCNLMASCMCAEWSYMIMWQYTWLLTSFMLDHSYVHIYAIFYAYEFGTYILFILRWKHNGCVLGNITYMYLADIMYS